MIKPMLAQDFQKDLSQRKIEKYAEDNDKFFVQPKLDGIRVESSGRKYSDEEMLEMVTEFYESLSEKK